MMYRVIDMMLGSDGHWKTFGDGSRRNSKETAISFAKQLLDGQDPRKYRVVVVEETTVFDSDA